MAEGSKAMSQMRKFLDQQEWKYLDEEAGVLRGLMTGQGSQWHWVARDTADGRFLLFYAYSPVNVPEQRLAAAAEYLMRANWGLYFGNFDMDWSNGQVCFRTCIPIGTSGVLIKALEHLVHASWAMMDRYLPGLFSVALGNGMPEQAVEDAEASEAENAVASPAVTVTEQPEPAGPGNPSRFRRFFPSDN